MPLEVLNVYEGQWIWPNGSDLSEVVNIGATVVMAQTWVTITQRANQSNTTSNTAWFTTIQLTSATQITLQRGGFSQGNIVNWKVTEFNDSVNVHRGSFTQNAITVNTTVPLVDLSKSISYCTFRTTTGVISQENIRKSMVRHRLTGTTELRSNIQTASAGHTIEYQIIEFTVNISVQTFASGNSTWPINITITGVAQVRTFLVFSWSANTTGNLCTEDVLSCRLTGPTTVRMEDFFAGSVNKFYAFYVVTYTGSDDFNVERGYDAINGNTVITPVVSTEKSRAMLIMGHGFESLIECDTCSNTFNHFACTSEVVSDTQIKFTRESSSLDATVAWELIRFPRAASPLPIMHHYYAMQRRRVKQ